MSSCTVHFDNYQGQYYPGNTILGKVVCWFNTSKNVRGIKLKFRGKEHNEWTKSESYYDENDKTSRTRTVNCSGDNKFLVTDLTLLGSGDINPGKHEYQFSFTLPKNLPGTYQGKYGYIKFSVKAVVDRPYKVDYEDEKEFRVVAPIDFNEIKNELQLNPVEYSDDKTLCCCCCASGPITMNVHLEKEAFVQGETVKVKIEITNLSNESIETVDVKMGMRIESKVTSPSSETKSDYELLATDRDTGVGAHGERTYNFNLEIPQSAVVPNFSLCTLFKQHSSIKVTAGLAGCHNDMELYASVVMGHIPIGGQFPQVGNQILPPVQNIQYPGGVAYPPTYTPFPPNPSNPPAYPSPYPPTGVATGPISPGGVPMGFQVPNNPPSEFPPLPAGAGPNPLPYPPVMCQNSASYPPPPGPSAPLLDDVASAPTKAELAGGDFVLVEGRGPADSDRMLPPSYNEAVPYPPKS